MIGELACSTECEVSVSYCVPPTEEIHTEIVESTIVKLQYSSEVTSPRSQLTHSPLECSIRCTRSLSRDKTLEG